MSVISVVAAGAAPTKCSVGAEVMRARASTTWVRRIGTPCSNLVSVDFGAVLALTRCRARSMIFSRFATMNSWSICATVRPGSSARNCGLKPYARDDEAQMHLARERLDPRDVEIQQQRAVTNVGR